MEKLKTKTD